MKETYGGLVTTPLLIGAVFVHFHLQILTSVLHQICPKICIFGCCTHIRVFRINISDLISIRKGCEPQQCIQKKCECRYRKEHYYLDIGKNRIFNVPKLLVFGKRRDTGVLSNSFMAYSNAWMEIALIHGNCSLIFYMSRLNILFCQEYTLHDFKMVMNADDCSVVRISNTNNLLCIFNAASRSC